MSNFLPPEVLNNDGSIRWMKETPRPAKVVICDLDGTIADCTHRLPLVKIPHPDSKGFKPDWDAFFDACVEDKPIQPIIELVRGLYKLGYRIVFLSGRSDRVLDKTVQWLSFHGFYPGENYEYLGMRKHGDHRPDDIVKLELLSELMVKMVINHEDIFCVIDDRSIVCEMWRKQGLTCLQVAKVDF